MKKNKISESNYEADPIIESFNNYNINDDFMNSILTKVKQGKPLSEKQQPYYDNILKLYEQVLNFDKLKFNLPLCFNWNLTNTKSNYVESLKERWLITEKDIELINKTEKSIIDQSKDNYNRLIELCKDKTIGIGGHWDADGVSSALFMYNLLKPIAKKIIIYSTDDMFEVSVNNFVHGFTNEKLEKIDEIKLGKLNKEVIDNIDYFVVTDCSPSTDMIRDKLIYIDHHPVNTITEEEVKEIFWNLSDVDAPSASYLVYKRFLAWKFEKLIPKELSLKILKEVEDSFENNKEISYQKTLEYHKEIQSSFNLNYFFENDIEYERLLLWLSFIGFSGDVKSFTRDNVSSEYFYLGYYLLPDQIKIVNYFNNISTYVETLSASFNLSKRLDWSGSPFLFNVKDLNTIDEYLIYFNEDVLLNTRRQEMVDSYDLSIHEHFKYNNCMFIITNGEYEHYQLKGMLASVALKGDINVCFAVQRKNKKGMWNVNNKGQDDNNWHGSSRSKGGFDCNHFIQCCPLIEGGGHPPAAGFKLENDKIEEFKQYLNDYFVEGKISHEGIETPEIDLQSVGEDYDYGM